MENIEIVDVTPELAREWLGFNTHNRNMRARTVLAYAADMASGDWRWTGDSVKFATDGTLLDGQHRLAAIAEAGCTITTLIVRGLKNDTQGDNRRRYQTQLPRCPQVARRAECDPPRRDHTPRHYMGERRRGNRR